MVKRRGKIIPNGVHLEKHENDIVIFFTNLGKTIELIPPSNIPHTKRPDFIMDSIEWEMKSPKQATISVVERAFDKALRQSCNIIIDIRRAKGREKIAIEHLEKCFKSSRRVKRLVILTKHSNLIDFKK